MYDPLTGWLKRTRFSGIVVYTSLSVQDKGVVVVRKEDAEPILTFLESYEAEVYARDVILMEEDLEQLKPREE